MADPTTVIESSTIQQFSSSTVCRLQMSSCPAVICDGFVKSVSLQGGWRARSKSKAQNLIMCRKPSSSTWSTGYQVQDHWYVYTCPPDDQENSYAYFLLPTAYFLLHTVLAYSLASRKSRLLLVLVLRVRDAQQ